MWKLWHVGKIFGTELKLHGTFGIMLAFITLSSFFRGGAIAAALSLGLGLLVFAVVVLHELGHIAAARHFGFPPKDIVLTPLGGVARFSSGGRGLPTQPMQEMAVAAAGPAVNLVLAGLALLTLKLVPWAALGTGGVFASSLTDWFLTMNVVLLVFNLIPALPMDGGRILRAALARKMGYLKATRMAAKVARWTTLAMAITAVATGNFTLLFIAGMVFVASWAEVAQAHVVEAQRNPMFQAFRGFSGGTSGAQDGGAPGGGAGGTVVDQYGNVVGGQPRSGWSAAQHVQPTPDGQGWTVRSARWLQD